MDILQMEGKALFHFVKYRPLLSYKFCHSITESNCCKVCKQTSMLRTAFTTNGL